MARTGTDSRTRPELSKAGIDAVWIPPVTKATSAEDNGYGVHDLDLGVRSERNGSHEIWNQAGIDRCHRGLHKNGIAVYVDLVMNHKAGADETERFRVVQVDEMDRTKDISKPFEIEGWTKFTFSGGDQYSSFQWNFTHGTDYDEISKRSGIFRIVGENKSWSDNVDNEFGNYDYLMFANIDYSHPDVRRNARMGQVAGGCAQCGFRLDAIKHINHDFIKEFATAIRKSAEMISTLWGVLESSFRTVETFWIRWITRSICLTCLFIITPAASKAGRSFDLRTIFDDTLVQSHPMNAVTFVDNHDSQPQESLESWVEIGSSRARMR